MKNTTTRKWFQKKRFIIPMIPVIMFILLIVIGIIGSINTTPEQRAEWEKDRIAQEQIRNDANKAKDDAKQALEAEKQAKENEKQALEAERIKNEKENRDWLVRKNESIAFVEYTIKEMLKSPSTAKFGNTSAIISTDETGETLLNSIWIVTGYVDSQNSYGAMIRTSFTIHLDWRNGKGGTIDKAFIDGEQVK